MICWYLKATREKSLVLNQSKTLKINCHLNANFTGIHGRKETTDPACVKSHTGYTITVANCSVLWQSTLQNKTAFIKMVVEIITLAHNCK